MTPYHEKDDFCLVDGVDDDTDELLSALDALEVNPGIGSEPILDFITDGDDLLEVLAGITYEYIVFHSGLGMYKHTIFLMIGGDGQGLFQDASSLSSSFFARERILPYYCAVSVLGGPPLFDIDLVDLYDYVRFFIIIFAESGEVSFPDTLGDVSSERSVP